MRLFLSAVALLLLAGEAQASLSASPSSVNFFRTEVGSWDTRTVYVRNNSDQDINISANDSCFGELSTSSSCFGYLNRYGSCTIRVNFRPRREGYKSCSITVRQTSGGYDTVYINVTGQGYERRR